MIVSKLIAMVILKNINPIVTKINIDANPMKQPKIVYATIRVDSRVEVKRMDSRVPIIISFRNAPDELLMTLQRNPHPIEPMRR